MSKWKSDDFKVEDRILYYLASHPDDIVTTRSLIRNGLDASRATISHNLIRMAKAGILERVERGKYQLPE